MRARPLLPLSLRLFPFLSQQDLRLSWTKITYWVASCLNSASTIQTLWWRLRRYTSLLRFRTRARWRRISLNLISQMIRALCLQSKLSRMSARLRTQRRSKRGLETKYWHCLIKVVKGHQIRTITLWHQVRSIKSYRNPNQWSNWESFSQYNMKWVSNSLCRQSIIISQPWIK